LGARRGRRHSETCVAVSETSGWSPAAITKPYGLSIKDLIIKVPKKLFTFEASLKLYDKTEAIKIYNFIYFFN